MQRPGSAKKLTCFSWLNIFLLRKPSALSLNFASIMFLCAKCKFGLCIGSSFLFVLCFFFIIRPLRRWCLVQSEGGVSYITMFSFSDEQSHWKQSSKTHPVIDTFDGNGEFAVVHICKLVICVSGQCIKNKHQNNQRIV